MELHVVIMLAVLMAMLVLQGWGSSAGRNFHRSPPKAAEAICNLQKQRRAAPVSRHRRPSLMYMALIVVAVAGGVSAGWWWTSGDGPGTNQRVESTRTDTVSCALARPPVQAACYCPGTRLSGQLPAGAGQGHPDSDARRQAWQSGRSAWHIHIQ